MRYIEWNNYICSLFFNSANEGKETSLYLTKADIVNIGKKVGENSEEAIWQDFLKAMRQGLPGTQLKSSIIEKALYCYHKWKSGAKAIDSKDVTCPLYIGYLAFLILPLTEIQGDFNANNYYDRVNMFFAQNNLKEENVTTANFKLLDDLWNDLSKWANQTKHRQLGSFQISEFSRPKYVGKPLSQCLFSPHSLRQLSLFFFEAGMVPNSQYSDSEIRMYLLRYGADILNLTRSTLSLIDRKDVDDLGQSVVKIVRREYLKWTGESHQVVETGGMKKTKRNFYPTRLYSQFKLNEVDESIIFSYRIRTENEFPEDLTLNNVKVTYDREGWSKTIMSDFNPALQLEDRFNKWIAKFPQKDVRLFLNGKYFYLSSDYWIETDTLSKVDWMYILSKSDLDHDITAWGRHFKEGCFSQIDFNGIPKGYSLFKLISPKESHKSLSLLTLFAEKNIRLVRGLPIGFRSYLFDVLPEVEVLNADGAEILHIRYNNSEEEFELEKSLNFENRWLLPKGIRLNISFTLGIKGEILLENTLSYVIVTSEGATASLDDSNLPARDRFGKRIEKTDGAYCVGSNVISAESKKELPYQSLFRGNTPSERKSISIPEYNHHAGNILLDLLTLKRISRTEDFYKFFEVLNSLNESGVAGNENDSYSRLKRASLNFLDYLGYLDYDYETKEVVVNPSQFVYLPSEKGRKVLLIGGRDRYFVERMLELAPTSNLQVEIRPQLSGNKNLLLPDSIIVKAFGDNNDNYGETNIRKFAESLSVKFYQTQLTQVALQLFSASIEEYEKDIVTNNKTVELDYDWARRIFNVDTFRYEPNTSDTFDKRYSLVEYKLNEYTYYDRLWINGECFTVDKNWGKYLILKLTNKQVILYDSVKKKVAVPLELPIPRLLVESIMLLSGTAPDYKVIDGRYYRVYENIPSIFIKNLFNKLRQQTSEFNL